MSYISVLRFKKSFASTIFLCQSYVAKLPSQICNNFLDHEFDPLHPFCKMFKKTAILVSAGFTYTVDHFESYIELAFLLFKNITGQTYDGGNSELLHKSQFTGTNHILD